MKTTRKFYNEWKSDSGWWRIVGEWKTLLKARRHAMWMNNCVSKRKRRIVEEIAKIHKV